MFHDQRKDILYRLAVTHGIASVDELGRYLPMPPTATVNGWLNKFLQTPKKFSAVRRYVNRFKLGADPEFCFGGSSATGRVDASLLGFSQGPAFGADNNGRLAEIRPYPSRSAVKVVASLLTTLRWMALLHATAVQHDWLSGAYLWDDGIGGHVHFGRKRPNRRLEIEALDHIEECLVYLRAYPADQVQRRRRGDARHQIYGQLGDFRLQQHGYEYRTFPSWLDSPALAFLTLVVSKLAVQAPDLYRFAGGVGQESQRLRNFLAYFKTIDDDARLALVMLDRGIPMHQGGDFKSRWGIGSSAVQSTRFKQVVSALPSCIPPDPESVGEVFEHLRTGEALRFRVPAFTWSPINPPDNYNMCIKTSTTVLQKGLGEMILDLCSHKDLHISFVSGSRGGPIPIGVSRDLMARLPRSVLKIGKIYQADLRPNTISIVPEWREGTRARQIKKILLSGVFPLWRVQDCKPDSFEKWQETVKRPKKKFVGRVVFQSTTCNVGPLA